MLYTIPHAGAGVAAVRPICRELADHMDTVAVRLPGRESSMDETPITDLILLATRLANQVQGHANGRHVYLYGHCAGALLAYETARLLDATLLDHLVVSAQQAPDRVPAGATWRLPREPFLAHVANDGYLPKEILDQPELVELVEPALRADYQAVECHSSTLAVLDTPILALLGADEHSVAVDDVAAWAARTAAGFRLDLLPGGHNLLADRYKEVAAAIRAVVA